jgi:hypothetical protein
VATQFRWDGLQELQQALKALPAELTTEGRRIVAGHANGTAVAIRAAYPWHSGNLRQHVSLTLTNEGPFGINATIKQTARHAWIFENGTQARYTKKGSPRGRMPAGKVFVPAMMRARARLYTELAALLARHGMQVTGA